ncbi:unnamed protein product [Sphagnum balticum]
MAKRSCNCEVKDEKIKENLYEIKRELALAKVNMSKSYIREARMLQNQEKKKAQDSSSESDCENSDSTPGGSTKHRR